MPVLTQWKTKYAGYNSLVRTASLCRSDACWNFNSYNSVFENLVCMLTVVENCIKCETWEEKQGSYVSSSPLSINFPMLNKTSAISNCEVYCLLYSRSRECTCISITLNITRIGIYLRMFKNCGQQLSRRSKCWPIAVLKKRSHLLNSFCIVADY